MAKSAKLAGTLVSFSADTREVESAAAKVAKLKGEIVRPARLELDTSDAMRKLEMVAKVSHTAMGTSLGGANIAGLDSATAHALQKFETRQRAMMKANSVRYELSSRGFDPNHILGVDRHERDFREFLKGDRQSKLGIGGIGQLIGATGAGGPAGQLMSQFGGSASGQMLMAAGKAGAVGFVAKLAVERIDEAIKQHYSHILARENLEREFAIKSPGGRSPKTGYFASAVAEFESPAPLSSYNVKRASAMIGGLTNPVSAGFAWFKLRKMEADRTREGIATRQIADVSMDAEVDIASARARELELAGDPMGAMAARHNLQSKFLANRTLEAQASLEKVMGGKLTPQMLFKAMRERPNEVTAVLQARKAAQFEVKNMGAEFELASEKYEAGLGGVRAEKFATMTGEEATLSGMQGDGRKRFMFDLAGENMRRRARQSMEKAGVRGEMLSRLEGLHEAQDAEWFASAKQRMVLAAHGGIAGQATTGLGAFGVSETSKLVRSNFDNMEKQMRDVLQFTPDRTDAELTSTFDRMRGRISPASLSMRMSVAKGYGLGGLPGAAVGAVAEGVAGESAASLLREMVSLLRAIAASAGAGPY